MNLPIHGQRPGYQELPNPAAGRTREEPFHFRWMKHEVTIIAIVEICWIVYLFYDFAKVNREVVNKEKIEGVTEGFFGIPRDTNDAQWNGWRNSLYIMVPVAIGHVIGAALIRKITDVSPDKSLILLYNIVVGIGFVYFVERAGIIYWALFTALFYIVIKFTHQWRIFPFILWGLSLLTLYMNEKHQGYGLKFISESLNDSLDHAPARWNVIFNMTILRMISFGMDLYWAQQQKPLGRNYPNLSYRQRQETHQPIRVYNLLTYYSYLLYIPLFLTGPIITFNAWVSQIYIPQKEFSRMDIFKYFLRLIFVFVCFEAFLHIYYINAIATNPHNNQIWQKYFQQTQHILMMSLLELFFLWFKFLIMWRVARLWSLAHGIEAPENMNRCVANNYCFEGFWRSWHRSFNQWLIRYIFIPLGGSKYKFYNIWAVFSFVAIWHDMNLNLLLWSWLICLSLMPEMFVKFYFHQRKMRPLWNKLWFRYAAAGLCTIVVLSMMIANLIGYGTGKDTLLMILKRVGNNEEIGVIIGASLLIFLNNNWLFKIREIEETQGQGMNF